MKKALTQTADHHNITRTRGNTTGNLDECELSDEERGRGAISEILSV